VQELLGDHQDAVVARPVLREIGIAAHLDGEDGFTYGLLHQQQTDAGRLSEAEMVVVGAENGRFGVRPVVAAAANPFATRAKSDPVPDDLRAVVLPDGSYQVFLAQPEQTSEVVDVDRARAAADRVAEEHGELVFDRITASFHTGAQPDGEAEAPDIAHFTAHYRQVVDGEFAVMGGDGHLRISVDRTGRVYHIDDRTVRVASTEPSSPSDELINVEEVLAEAQSAELGCAAADCDVTYNPDEDEIGYRFNRDEGVLVARREVEVTRNGFTNRRVIEVPM
jgi:hypothetical protein